MGASDECYTPAEWVQRARDVMGAIDTDPTSNETANQVVKARRFYTAEQDALRARLRWRGRVWFQPPYCKPLTPLPFVQKLLREYDAGHCTQAVGLLNARPGSEWFQALARQAWRCEKRGRIRFYGPGIGKGNGFQDSVFFYLGPDVQRFAAVFADVGQIVAPSVTLGVTGRACEACGRSLDAHRSDAVACTPRCRKRLERMRAR